MRIYRWIFVLGLVGGVAALFIAFSTERDDTVSKPGGSGQIERENVARDGAPDGPVALRRNLDRPELDLDQNANPLIIVDSFPAESQLELGVWRGAVGSGGHFDRLDRLAAPGVPDTGVSPNDILVARGWAGDPGLGLRLHEVVLVRCDRIVARAQVTLDRPDVAAAVHPNLVRSGWEAQIFAGDLPSCGDDNMSAWAVIPGNPALLISLIGRHGVRVASSDVPAVTHVSAQTVPRPDAYAAPSEVFFDILASRANLRRCGSTKCAVVAQIDSGTHPGVLLENDGSWSLLAFGDRQGWLFNDLYRRTEY